MRILMWFTVGFVASCAGSVYLLPAEALVPLAATAFALCVLALFAVKKWRVARIFLVLLLGIGAGALRCHYHQSVTLAPVKQLDGVTVEAELTARDYTYETAYGYAVEAETDIGGKMFKVRVYLDEEIFLEPGERFRSTFRFRFTEPKEGEKISYLQSTGTFLTADQREKLTLLGLSEARIRYLPARISQSAKDTLRKAFPEDVYPFVKAVLLGDTSDLSYEVDTDMKLSGIRHVVAVSGLHVSILYGFVEAVTGKKRFLTALVGLPVLILFAAVAGFSPSVTRACVMAGLMMVAKLLDKEYDGLTALSAACLLMLAMDPVAVGSVSLQLSAGCVAGILMFQGKIQAWIDRHIRNVEKKERTKLKSWFSASVAVTLGAMSLTTPLSAYYFGTVSLVGILTNLLTLWVLTVVFIGIITVCILGLLWMPGAVIVGKLLAWPVRYVLLVARILSRTPFSAVYMASPFIVGWLVLAYILLAVFLITGGKRAPLYIFGVLLSLLAALGLSWLRPAFSDCRVTALDVGQGQAVIVQTEGKTFLVDCGGSYPQSVADTVSSELLSMGIARLDAVILTHEDTDHSGALPYLLTRIETDALILPATAGGYELPRTDAWILWVDRRTQLSFGDTVITLYPPLFSASNNENSLCILFDTEKCDILFTGDRSRRGEEALLAQYPLPKVDLLIAGHHGSKNSTGDALLAAVQPETVIVSVGKNNIYGHPAPELLERLRTYGCTVSRTDLDGKIVYRR